MSSQQPGASSMQPSSLLPHRKHLLTPPQTPAAKSRTSTAASAIIPEPSARSASHPYRRIRQSLTIGHDNYADVTAEALFKRSKDDFQTRLQIQASCNKGKPFESDQAYERFLVDLYRDLEAKATVRFAHPKATDDSVRYTVIPSSPFGKITIRWWNNANRGFLFDFVNIEELKVVKPDSNLIIKLQVENASWVRIPSLEVAKKAAISTDTHFEYPLNADGIVEERWSVPQGSRIALHQKGCLKPFIIVRAPELDPFPGESISELLPTNPEP